MLPRFTVPRKTEIFVDSAGFQAQRVFRFLNELSKGSWKKSYPPTASDGTVHYAVTSSPALVSSILESITTYQRDDQTWLADINIIYTVASAARTVVVMSVSNIKFKNAANLNQAVTGYAIDGSGAYVHHCYTVPNTGNIQITHASATTTIYAFSKKGLILEEQPDFAE